MSRAFELVRGDLRVDGPGAHGVPVRLDGRGTSLRVELGSGWWGLIPIVDLLPIGNLRHWLAREGITISLVIRGSTVLELGGDATGASRLHPVAALRALRGAPLRHYPAALRAGWDLLRTPRVFER